MTHTYKIGDTARFHMRDFSGIGVVTKAPWHDDEGTWIAVKAEGHSCTYLFREEELTLEAEAAQP